MLWVVLGIVAITGLIWWMNHDNEDYPLTDNDGYPYDGGGGDDDRAGPPR